MWAFMRGGGSAKDADAQHAYVECMRQPDIGMMELITPKVPENRTLNAIESTGYLVWL